MYKFQKREYEKKRIFGLFQSYDMNIDSHLHFREEEINPGGVDKKTRWLEKTYAVQVLCLNYQSEAKQTNLCFKNIKTYRFCTHLRFKFL